MKQDILDALEAIAEPNKSGKLWQPKANATRQEINLKARSLLQFFENLDPDLTVGEIVYVLENEL